MELLAFGKTGWGDELFYATLMTIAVSVTAMFIGFFFALIFTPLKLSKYKSLNLIGNFYTTVIRGVPELLVIYLFFFGGSGAIMYVASIFGYFEYIEINAFITGSMAIGIISGAYSTEVFRGAIQSIDKGQFEAAKVLGVGKFATTGDGLLVALEVLFAIRKGMKASIFFNKFKKTPQILKNIDVKDRTIINNFEVKKSIKIAEKLMKKKGRILVRKSGTESKIRVMGESENKKLLNNCINIISKKIK